MGRWRTGLAVAVAIAVAAACVGGDDDAADRPDDEPAIAEEDREAVATAAEWLEESYGLDEETLGTLSPTAVEASPAVSHVRFGQSHEGVPVIDAEIIVHVLADGRVQGASDALVEAHPPAGVEEDLDEDEAGAIAEKAVRGTPSGSPTAELAWLDESPELRLVWAVDVTTSDPVAAWTVLVDATTSAVVALDERGASHRRFLASRSAIGDRVAGLPIGGGGDGDDNGGDGGKPTDDAGGGDDSCELPEGPSACVFQPDPIFAAGGDLGDPGVADDFLVGVELQGLDDPASGALVGEFADVEPGNAPVPAVREDDTTWGGGRGDPGFEAAMAYYWVDYTQRAVQDLGFSDVRNESFPVVPIDPGTVDNAYYSAVEEQVYLGVGSDGINEGEDATGIIHEYGHALLDDVQPALFGEGDPGAYHEAFGDLLAFLVTLEFRDGDAACLFAWTEENQCLRRVDEDRTYPDDLVRQVHEDGTIYSGAVYDVVVGLLDAEGLTVADCVGSDACDEVRDRVLTTVLASHNYLTGGETLPDVAAAYLAANEASFDDADADLLAAAFADHGLDDGTAMDDGPPTVAPGAAAVDVDIEHSYRGDLAVTVGVVDAGAQELCAPVVLATPDAQDARAGLMGTFDVSDSDCAAFLPPSPDQQWVLRVEDTLPEDEGEVVGFVVHHEGTPYRAGGLPLPVADGDPGGTTVLVDGSGEEVDPDGMVEPGGPPGDGPALTLDVRHPYAGDLAVRGGVADADGDITCSVVIHRPDPSDASADIGGSVDMGECAALYPPAPDRQWFLQVIDTAELDEGTVEGFSLEGPDGSTHQYTDGPVEVPDDDPDGVALLLDGSGAGGSSGGGTAGGAGQGRGPVVSFRISHPYAGDLAVAAGVADASGASLCEVRAATPDPRNAEADLADEVSLARCAELYPPGPDRRWYLFVTDTLSRDEGRIEEVTLTGPEGVVRRYGGGPVVVPDADPGGATVFIEG